MLRAIDQHDGDVICGLLSVQMMGQGAKKAVKALSWMCIGSSAQDASLAELLTILVRGLKQTIGVKQQLTFGAPLKSFR